MGNSDPRSRWTVLAALLAVSVALWFSHARGWLEPAERITAVPIAAVQSWMSANLSEFNNFVTTVQTIGVLRSQVEELTRENDRLTIENVRLKEELNRAAIFEKLLKFQRANPSYQYVTAEVIGRDTDLNLHTLRLGKGVLDGVDMNMPVITERGLVGRVVDVGPNWCQVLLIVDGSSNVRARLQQSRAEGVITGRGQATLLMDYITQGIEISSGEIVLTSGMGGGFPAGLVVGQVTSVRQSDEALFQQADVRPSVDFERLEIVMIITNFDRSANAGAPAATPEVTPQGTPGAPPAETPAAVPGG